MSIKRSISILVLSSLLAACQLVVVPPSTQPSNADAVGTAVELTAAAKFTEMAGSAVPATAVPTLMVTPTVTSSTPVVPVSGSCSGPTVTATVDANIRSGPGTAYNIVGSLMLGQTATVVGRNDANTWWYIAYPGISGGYAWIAGSVVTTACLPSVVQVVAAPPLPTEEVADAGGSDDGGDGPDATETPFFLVATFLGADLVPAGMSVDPSPAIQGEEVHIRIEVKNQGNVPSGSFTMQLWSSPVKIACTWTVSSLAAGESVNKSCSHTYPGSMTYPIKLVIDSGGTVSETNEDNNVWERKLKVNPAP